MTKDELWTNCNHRCGEDLRNMFIFYIFSASWWMCRPRTNRVYLWAAQRPYPASLGNISCYKGTASSSDTLWEQTVPVTPTQYKISAKGCYCFTCVMFWQVQKYGTMEMHWIFRLFIHSGPLFFRSLKERPNNVKNGCSASMDDSELNTTPDGQVLQVVLSLQEAFINIKGSISCKTYFMFSIDHMCLQHVGKW